MRHQTWGASPHTFINTLTQKPAKPLTGDDEPLGPALYDTGLTPEEGLWTRKGWAGRS